MRQVKLILIDPLGKRITLSDALDETLKSARENHEPVYNLL